MDAERVSVPGSCKQPGHRFCYKNSMRILAGIAIVALALAVTACGGDDSDDGDAATATTEMGTSDAPDSASGGEGAGEEGDAPEGEVPESGESASGDEAVAAAKVQQEGLVSCLKRAGYKADVIPPPAEGVPGAEFGTLGTVSVNAGSGNGVAAIFFENAQQARELSDSPVGAQQEQSEVVGNVYLGVIGSKAPKVLKAFRTCLKGLP